MRVLVLGGTGSIGSAVVRELIRFGHDVAALARSETSAERAAQLGALSIPGDIATPDQWLAKLPPLDGVVHAAAAFTADDANIERRLLQKLLPFLSSAGPKARFVYTGGCWLLGPAEGETVATEHTPLAPLPAFEWMVPHSRLVLETPAIHPIVIHPAMVYEAGGGVFSRFRADALERAAVRVVGSEHVRWPLVHSEDLATLYRLALERSDPQETYLGAAIDAVPVGRIARAFARQFGTRNLNPEVISEDTIAAELGEWARGYGRDQRQSGEKARRCLGWEPKHLDPEGEIASIA
ncbi:MAG: NAD-dependent epimerase/dehydratase family protein [Gammaproteobacteria bacterium]